MVGETGKVWIHGNGETARLLVSAGLFHLPTGVRAQANDVLVDLERVDSKLSSARLAVAEAWHWNRHAKSIMALGNAELGRRLEREGFKTALGQMRREPGAGWRPAVRGIGSRRITVRVFGLAETEMEPLLGQSIREQELGRRLSRASARALYVLGLELGTVEWEVNGSGREGLLVALSPKLSFTTKEAKSNLVSHAAAFALDWHRETSEGCTATIGADPEFVMLGGDGKVVSAARFFAPDGKAGCDAVMVGGVQRWPLAELRPDPSAEPRALAERIRRLLVTASRRTGDAQLVWRAGAAPVRGLPLGGHLHFSGVALTSERLRALDNVVALPLRILEPPGAARRLPRYGALGDFRLKAHGGFEYRTPPSWLVSPQLAVGTLALAKLAAEHARELASVRPLDEEPMREAFYKGDREVLRTGAERVIAALQQTSAYSQYQAEIDPICDAVRRGLVWDERTDLRVQWHIRRPSERESGGLPTF